MQSTTVSVVFFQASSGSAWAFLGVLGGSLEVPWGALERSQGALGEVRGSTENEQVSLGVSWEGPESPLGLFSRLGESSLGPIWEIKMFPFFWVKKLLGDDMFWTICHRYLEVILFSDNL